MTPTAAVTRFGLVLASLALVWTHGEPMRADVMLRRLVPELDRDSARHLTHDDDRALAAYAARLGQHRLRQVYERIDNRLWKAAPEAYVATLQVLGPHHGRLARLIASTGFTSTGWEHQFRMQLGARGVELNRVASRLHEIQADNLLGAVDKIAVLTRIREDLDRLGYTRGVISADALMGKEYARIGRGRDRMERLQLALGRSRDVGDVVMLCQLLGELSHEHTLAGKADSAMLCLEEAVALADRFEIPTQAARLRLFLAGQHLRRGRFVVAADLLEDAQRAARRMEGSSHEIRALYESMNLYARMGCWDMVRRHARRVRPLLRAQDPLSPDLEGLELAARRWDARIAFASGRRAEAIRALETLRAPYRRSVGIASFASITADHARWLLEVDSLDAADRTAASGLAFADSNGLHNVAGELAEVRARAAVRSGDRSRALAAVADARRRSAMRLGTPALIHAACDLLDVELAMKTASTAAAVRCFSKAYAAFRDSIRTLEGGPHSQLVLGEASGFHAFGHRLMAHRPDAGMRFELDWRSLPGTMGRQVSRPTGDVVESTPALEELGDAIHVVYAFTPAGLCRWTRLDRHVQRDDLALATDEWDARVERVLMDLSRDPGADARLPDSLRAALVELGLVLLPDAVRAHPGRPVLVTADGSLARLPFEALHAGAGRDYVPLLARSPVVYARAVPARARSARTGTAILAGAGPGSVAAQDVERRVSLPAVEREADDVARRLPGARIQFSESVRRPDVIESWQQAQIVYVASHLVRDPDAPLLAHFPLGSRGQTDRLDDGVIDLRDVTTADLTGCDLAVLSSCASGEPYVVAGRSGPSMADAMADGGAATVIHTRWRVRDERAAVVAPALAEAWVRSRDGRVLALWHARQQGLRLGADWRHPFEWAAWSTTVRWPVGRWDAAPQGAERWIAARARSARGEPGATRITASK